MWPLESWELCMWIKALFLLDSNTPEHGQWVLRLGSSVRWMVMARTSLSMLACLLLSSLCSSRWAPLSFLGKALIGLFAGSCTDQLQGRGLTGPVLTSPARGAKCLSFGMKPTTSLWVCTLEPPTPSPSRPALRRALDARHHQDCHQISGIWPRKGRGRKVMVLVFIPP